MHKFVIDREYDYNEIKSKISDNYIIHIITPNFNFDYISMIKSEFTNILIYYYIFNDDISRLSDNLIDMIYYKNDAIYNVLKKTIPEYKLEKIIVVTFGTYDLYHIGHQRIFERSREYGETLIVGISSDDLNSVKGKCSHQKLQERLDIVKNNTLVTDVFVEESLELKNEYIKQHNGNILIMGDDWVGRFDWVDCLTIYLPRTPDISSTMLRSQINI